MCLAVPVKIESIEGKKAVVNLEGNRMNVLLGVTSGAKVGDWVLVHAGVAITVLDPKEAKETYDLLRGTIF